MVSRFGLRVVAGFEAAKGFVVLAVGLGLFRLIHRDVGDAAERLVRHLHLDVDSHYPRLFIDAADRLDDAHLRTLAIVALLYSVVRFVEGYGLWRDRRWAEWFGAVSGAIYLPLEVFKLWEKVSWLRVGVLAVNCVVVFYLIQILVRKQIRPPEVVTPPGPPAGS
jgi:uncharacterized membrane protein (DUF2068 family)